MIISAFVLLTFLNIGFTISSFKCHGTFRSNTVDNDVKGKYMIFIMP